MGKVIKRDYVLKNYDRYQNYSEQKYNKKGISYLLMKKQADRVLIPYLNGIKNKKILEVGLGYGYYTNYLIKNRNLVMGFDINPELGKNIGIEVVEGHANKLLEKINDKFDNVVSFFMTEYLNPEEMEEFITQSIQLLKPGGIFASTVIVNRGLGWLYITLARMKGIQKYNYSEKQIRNMIRAEKKVTITHLRTILGIPFAFLIEAEK